MQPGGGVPTASEGLLLEGDDIDKQTSLMHLHVVIKLDDTCNQIV